MEFTEILSKLNWWAILLSTVSSVAVGFLWYDKRAFGKVWMKLVGLSTKQVNSTAGMANTITWMVIVSFISVVALGYLMKVAGINGFLNGLVFGACVGAVFRLGTHIIHDGFSRRPAALTIINGGHDIIALSVVGALLGTWM